jgi:transcriptional regulator with XRE-family HTH domain
VIRERGFSYSEMGRLADVQPSQIGRFMRGKRGLTSDSLDRICAGLGLAL